MSNENVYYITIPTLRNNATSTFYGKDNTYKEKSWTSTYFDGDMYFDSELVKNKKKKAFDGCTIRIRIDSAIKTGFNLLGISISQLISPAKLDSTVRFQFFFGSEPSRKFSILVQSIIIKFSMVVDNCATHNQIITCSC